MASSAEAAGRLDIQRHQLGAAQRAGEADQQQRAVTPPPGAVVAGCEQAPQHGEGERRRLLPRPPVAAQQPLQRLLDMAVPGIPRQIIEAMHLADGGEAAANGAARVALGEACQIGADRRRRCRHRAKPGTGAPVRVVLPVGLVGP